MAWSARRRPSGWWLGGGQMRDGGRPRVWVAAITVMVVRRRPTLPPSPPGSTIGADGLSFRVRNGAGRFPAAMAAVTLWRCSSASFPAWVVPVPVAGSLVGPGAQVCRWWLRGWVVRLSGTAQWTRAVLVYKPSDLVPTHVLSRCAGPGEGVALRWGWWGWWVWQVIGLLVPVSFMRLWSARPHPAYQPSRLAGSLSGNTPWRPHLEASFPLRCLQRLSLPNVANQRCSWRNNWHTRGSSVPVLSY